MKEEKQFGFSYVPVHLDPKIHDLTLADDPRLFSLIPKWDPKREIKRRTRIKEIEEILSEIQEEIDYEAQRCKCCGVHPDEADKWTQ